MKGNLPYKKYITTPLGSNVIGRVDENRKLTLEIPLFSSNWNYPVNLVMYYCLDNTENNSNLGFHTKLNYAIFDIKRDETNETYTINFPNFISEIFKKDANIEGLYKSKNSSKYLYIYGNSITLFDENGIKYNLDMSNQTFPEAIYDQSHTNTLLTFGNDYSPKKIMSITSKTNERIEFEYELTDQIKEFQVTYQTQFITKARVYRPSVEGNDLCVCTIEFEYDLFYNYPCLKKITRNETYEAYSKETIITFSLVADYFQVHDSVSNASVRYYYTRSDINYIINSIEEGYYDSNNNYYVSNKVNIEKHENIVTITDYLNNEEKWLLSHERVNAIRKDNIVQSIEYTDEGIIKTMSPSLDYNISSGNLILNGSFQNGTTNWIITGSSTISSTYTNYYGEYFNGKYLQLNSNNISLSQTVEVDGALCNSVTLSYYVYDNRNYVADTNSLSTTITLLNDDTIVDTKTFDVSLSQDGKAWCLMAHSITPKQSYNKVKVEFKNYTGTTELRFTGISLYKDIVTSCHEYDDNNNTSRVIVGDRKKEYYYLPGDKHNVVYKNVSNTGSLKCEYDDDLLPTVTKDKYGIIKRTMYDEAKNVTETKVVNYDNKYTSVNYEYNSSNIEELNRQFLTKTIDENSIVSDYSIDSESKVVKKISKPNNLNINYLYNFGNISKIRYSNEETNENKTVNISSTNDGYPLEYTDPNSKKISFEYYDGDKQLKYVKPANSKLKEYTYKTYDYSGKIVHTSIIDTIKYTSTNELFKYNYVNNLLDNIDYITNVTKRIAKLHYDSYDRLKKIESYDYISSSLKETKEYEYNVNHQLIKEQIDNIIVNYFYEQNRVGYQFPEKEYYQSMVNGVTEVNYHLKEMFDSLKRPMSPFGTIYSLSFMEEEDNALTYYSNNSSSSLMVKEAIYGKDVFNTCYNMIPCADYYSDITALGYELDSYHPSTNKGSALMWFKPNLHSNQVLFSLGRSDGDYIKLYINDTYSMLLAFGINGQKVYENRLDELGIWQNDWNFVGFTWDLNSSNIFRCEFEIALNENVISLTDNEIFPNLGSSKYLISIGCIRDSKGNIELADKYNGLLTGIMITDTRTIPLSDVARYYHDYYNSFNNPLGSIAKYNITNQYNYQDIMESNNLDIISYNNSLVSFKGIKPSLYKQRHIKNKKEVFEYDNELEDLALNLDSGYLAYDLGLGQSGTILMEFKAFLLKEKRMLLKNKFGTFDVSVYIKSDCYVYLNFNGTEHNTNLRIRHEKWNELSFGYTLAIVSSSLSVYTFSFRIVLNGVEYITVLEANQYISYTNIQTYIGSDITEAYSLDGLLSKVAFTDIYLNKQNIVSLFSSLVPIKAISRYDVFNRRTNKKVFDNYEHYSIIYNYDTNDSKIYNRVSSEHINHARYDYDYNYSYDARGNLNRITKNGTLYRAYEYDHLNQLVKETHYDKNKYIKYVYDNNGNIGLKYVNDNTTNNRLETYNYSYDGTYKDKLIAYNNQTISYSSSDSALPTTMGNYNLTWFSNKLVKMTIPGTNYYISFEYNSVGERISKRVYLSNKNYRINYTYLNGQMIREEKTNNVTNQTSYKYFTYDTNGELLSIKINDIDYYYVKNAFGDILGLARYDEEELYVSYEYDAWGNVTGYGSRDNSDVYINPFIYKGYYYDEETGLFWLSSRYYSPELCRWISPDDISYLDPQSVNGLNLYCYCKNNPIMNVDPTGHFAISLTMIGLIVGAVIGATAGGIAAYNIAKDQGAEGWELFGWTMAGIVGGGLIGGALGAGAGALVTKATGILGLSIVKGNVFVVTKTMVLGHYGYAALGTSLGYGFYEISDDLYYSMTDAQRWAMNSQFLNDCYRLGANFIVEPTRTISPTYNGNVSWLYYEIQYLIDKGYQWLEDLSALVRG